MTMITPSYLGETIEYSSLHACRSTLEDPTVVAAGVEAIGNGFLIVAGQFTKSVTAQLVNGDTSEIVPTPVTALVEQSFEQVISHKRIRAHDIWQVTCVKASTLINCPSGGSVFNGVTPAVTIASQLIEKDAVQITVEKVCDAKEAPHITSITPNTGAEGTLVTIEGCNLFPASIEGRRITVMFDGFCAQTSSIPGTPCRQVVTAATVPVGQSVPVFVQNVNGAVSNSVLFTGAKA